MIRFCIGARVFRHSGPPNMLRPWGIVRLLHEDSCVHRLAFAWLCEQDIDHHFEWDLGTGLMGQDEMLQQVWAPLRCYLLVHDDGFGAMFRLFHPVVARDGVVLS